MSYLNIPTKNTGDTFSSAELNSIVKAVQNLQKAFGWGTYFDTQYTISSPQVLVGDDDWQILKNNAGGKIEDYLPYGVASLYDSSTNKIQANVEGSTGNGYISFFAKTDTSQGAYSSVGLDINGNVGIIFKTVLTFPRGANIWHPFTIPINAYTLDTFVQNGGIPKISTPTGQTISIYGTTFFVNLLSRPL